MRKNHKHHPVSIRLRPADIILIIILISFSITGFVLQKRTTREGKFYTVEVARKTLYRFSLHSDTLITIKGKTGDIKIRVQSRRVSVLESSCPLKICVKTGWIKRPGEAIICVPNNTVIRIEGEKKEEVDAITQ